MSDFNKIYNPPVDLIEQKSFKIKRTLGAIKLNKSKRANWLFLPGFYLRCTYIIHCGYDIILLVLIASS
jgi:hypothetical protein